MENGTLIDISKVIEGGSGGVQLDELLNPALSDWCLSIKHGWEDESQYAICCMKTQSYC